MALQVVKQFTTQSGSWDVNPSNRFGITPELRDAYKAGSVIPGAGAQHNIFINAPVGSRIELNTKKGDQYTTYMVGSSGWVNHPMASESWYDPDKGQQGPWTVRVNGIEVIRGIGLPFNWHVSTFIVVQDTDSINAGPAPTMPTYPIPSPAPVGQYTEVVVRTTTNGVKKELVVWHS